MSNHIRYVHTNLIARDWKRLAQFYIDVFDCRQIGPERDLSGEWIEKLTQIEGVHIRGVHLLLPGYDDTGPTLEIFQYMPGIPDVDRFMINRLGFGHIAFLAEDVEGLLARFIKHGGQPFGEVVKKQYPELGLLTVAYARDPEGNLVEIQNWKK